jgi:hypothetical protein
MPPKTTRFDALVRWTKNNRVTVALLVVLAIVGGAARLLTSVKQIRDAVAPANAVPTAPPASGARTEPRLTSPASPARPTPVRRADVQLAQFALNTRACYFKRSGSADDPEWEPSNRWHEMIGLSRGSPSRETDGTKRDERSRQYSEILSRLFPVFDITLLNRGDDVAILRYVRVEVLDESPWGGGDASLGTPPEPLLKVAERYVVDLAGHSSLDTPKRRSVPADLVPPLQIGPALPVRFQLQFTPAASEVRRYQLQLKFDCANADPVFTVPFSVIF